jgi:GTPase SAR1 family protein
MFFFSKSASPFDAESSSVPQLALPSASPPLPSPFDDMVVEANQAFVLDGPPGAGKTTLAAHLTAASSQQVAAAEAKVSLLSVTTDARATNACRVQPGRILRTVLLDTPGFDGNTDAESHHHAIAEAIHREGISKVNGVILMLSMSERLSPDRRAAFLENPLLEQGAPLLICISKSLLYTEQTRLAFKEEVRTLFPIAKDILFVNFAIQAELRPDIAAEYQRIAANEMRVLQAHLLEHFSVQFPVTIPVDDDTDDGGGDDEAPIAKRRRLAPKKFAEEK